MLHRIFRSVCFALVMTLAGCPTRYRDDLDYSHPIKQTFSIEELHFGELVQFQSVQWNPDDDLALRTAIVEDAIVSGRDVFEIGTSTGLLSVLCLQNGADKMVATDFNPVAIDNAKYNAALLVPDQKLDARNCESEDPFSVLKKFEKFDLVLIQPSWYLQNQEKIDVIVSGLAKHLRPGARGIFVVRSNDLAEAIRRSAEQQDCGFRISGNTANKAAPSKVTAEADVSKGAVVTKTNSPNRPKHAPQWDGEGVIVEIRPPLGRDKVGGSDTEPEVAAPEVTAEAEDIDSEALP